MTPERLKEIEERYERNRRMIDNPTMLEHGEMITALKYFLTEDSKMSIKFKPIDDNTPRNMTHVLLRRTGWAMNICVGYWDRDFQEWVSVGGAPFVDADSWAELDVRDSAYGDPQPSDTAPKSGKKFMAWDPIHRVWLHTMHWNNDCFMTEYEQWSGKFTYWMPGPPIPDDDY
jgi:hypothetical protein